jgi:hypothetical protein
MLDEPKFSLNVVTGKKLQIQEGLVMSEFLALVVDQRREGKPSGYNKLITVAANESARLRPTMATMLPHLPPLKPNR